ncbi:MAG: cadherin-like domain-containing protein [Cyanobacteria bacterium P01_E01_bin.42]
MNKQFKQYLKLLVGIVLAIALAIASPNTAFAQTKTLTYTEGKSPVRVSDSIAFSGGLQYGDGELRFSLRNGTPNDQLNLASAANPKAKGAISVDSSGSVFLGNGSGTDRIGSIVASDDGSNGKPLTIRFASPLTNAGFETGDLTGWTAFESNYSTSVQNLNDQTIPSEFGGSPGSAKIMIAPAISSPTYTVSIDSSTVGSGKYSLRLQSNGSVAKGYGSLHGPYVRSDAFNAFAGDNITLDFSAQQGSDAYEVFGFLVEAGSDDRFGTGDDSRTQLFSKRGDTILFNSVSATIAKDGLYQFEFVCGSYDQTGGKALGASLYVDNVRLVSSTSITDAVVQAIADRVEYSNTSNNPDTTTRQLDITRKTASNATDSVAVNIAIVSVNNAPTLVANNRASVKDGNAIQTGDIQATDPDDSSAELTYTITSAPRRGKIQVAGIQAASFTQADLDAGRVTYISSGSNATADSFKFTLADGGEDGVAPVKGIFRFDLILSPDSIRDFAKVQGTKNWYYGYYPAPSDINNLDVSTFKLMTKFKENFWWFEKGVYETRIAKRKSKPNSVLDRKGRPKMSDSGQPLEEQWAARRWESDVDGSIRICGRVAKYQNEKSGDGTLNYIFVNGGSPVFSQDIAGPDTVGVEYSVDLTVKSGDKIDFVTAPKNDDFGDSTFFTATIADPKLAVCPSP